MTMRMSERTQQEGGLLAYQTEPFASGYNSGTTLNFRVGVAAASGTT